MWKICRLLCLGCHDFYSAKRRCTSHNAKHPLPVYPRLFNLRAEQLSNCNSALKKKIAAFELGLQRLGECRRLQDRQSTLSSEGFSTLARMMYLLLTRSSSKWFNQYAYKWLLAIMPLYISLLWCFDARRTTQRQYYSSTL